MQYEVRTETSDDYPAIRAVLCAAFPTPAEADLVEALRGCEDHLPELALVSCENGQPIAHIFFSRAKIVSDDASIDASALAPMAVLPEYQRRGVGTMLVRNALHEAKRHGHDWVIVAGHPDYYPRFGFVPASRFGIRAPFSIPDECFLALPLRSPDESTCAGIVRYAAPFADLIG